MFDGERFAHGFSFAHARNAGRSCFELSWWKENTTALFRCCFLWLSGASHRSCPRRWWPSLQRWRDTSASDPGQRAGIPPCVCL